MINKLSQFFLTAIRNQEQFVQITKSPIVWVTFLPIIVCGILSFFVSLHYRAFHDVLVAQVAIEDKITALSYKVAELSLLPQMPDVQNKINNLNEQIKEEREKLLHFKNDWGSSTSDIFRRYYQRGSIAVGDAYIPFVYALFVPAFLFLSISVNISIPFYIRAGSLSTGSVLALVIIAQFVFAVVHTVRWYTKLTGVIFIPLVMAGVVVNWLLFIKNYKKV